jgi:hypothetical protein
VPTVRAAVHVRTRDRVAVVEALSQLLSAEGLVPVDPKGRAPRQSLRVLVGKPQGDWIAVCPEDVNAARGLAQALAAETDQPTIAVGMVDDEALFYAAYDGNGLGVDEYHQCPDYEKEADEDDADDDELERTRGDAVALVQGVGGGKADELGQALQKGRIERLRDHDPAVDTLPADEVLAALRASLKLPDLVDFDERVAEAGDEHVLTWTRPEPTRLEKLKSKIPTVPTLPWQKQKAEGAAKAEDDDDEEGDDEDEDLESSGEDDDADGDAPKSKKKKR